MGHKIRIGEKVQFQVAMEEIQQLEYKDVGNALTLSSKDKGCTHETFDDCMYEVVAAVMKEETEGNCTVPWIRNNSNICSTSKDISTAYWIGWTRITNQKKDCLLPCQTMTVNVGAKNRICQTNITYSQVHFYFPANVLKSREQYLYTFMTLIGRIGGYLGLYRLALWILDLVRLNPLLKN